MKDDPNRIYQLNGIAHIAGFNLRRVQPYRCFTSMRMYHGMLMNDRIIPYMHMARLALFARLNGYWFRLNKQLVSAFVERWWL
ncbi:uncharacterized protein DS421_9g264350 [Arachis hypogaea]|nr:uncharacterized protein DS421_9g264350 [Arachis hypogaea]